MFINLIFDSVDTNVPAGFQAAMRTAANMISSTIAGNYTVNLNIGWGSFNNVIDPTLTGTGGAYANANGGQTVAVATVRQWLAARTLTSLDTAGLNGLANTVANLPANNGIYVTDAQLRALGHFSCPANTVDGGVAFGTNVSSSVWISVALHEMTHAIGRITVHYAPAPVILDLFRYDGTGHFQWSEGQNSASPAYFSLDGGQTGFANFSTTSDYSDLENDNAGFDPNDPFDAFYTSTTVQSLTRFDRILLDDIGYTHATTQDFTGAGVAGLVLQSGATVLDWSMVGGKVSTGHLVSQSLGGWGVVGAGDFNADGTSDLLLQNSLNGALVSYDMQGGVVTQGFGLVNLPAGWGVVGTGDFNGDGTTDVLAQNGGSIVAYSILNNVNTGSTVVASGLTGYAVVGTGDFNGDGTTDILLENSAGSIFDWQMHNGVVATGFYVGGAPGWTVVGVGDFNGDFTPDVLLENSSGDFIDWIISNHAISGSHYIASAQGWSVVGTGDYNGDGTSDIALKIGNTVIDWTLANGMLNGSNYVGDAAGYSVYNLRA